MPSFFQMMETKEIKCAETLMCYIQCHVTSKFITLTHCPQLLWKTRMNQINIEEVFRSGRLSVQPMDLAGAKREGNKQGVTLCAVYLAVIDD